MLPLHTSVFITSGDLHIGFLIVVQMLSILPFDHFIFIIFSLIHMIYSCYIHICWAFQKPSMCFLGVHKDQMDFVLLLVLTVSLHPMLAVEHQHYFSCCERVYYCMSNIPLVQ